jgi:hypothetical protein
MDYDSAPDSYDCESSKHGPAIDPALRSISDRYFVNIRSETYRSVRLKEADVLAVPWGPRIDVMFDPKGAPGIIGGKVRVMARTAGTEVEIGNLSITSADQPLAISIASGCDEYVVKAQLGTDPGPGAHSVESYFFARVYDGR